MVEEQNAQYQFTLDLQFWREPKLELAISRV
jgi:hypothetical protein